MGATNKLLNKNEIDFHNRQYNFDLSEAPHLENESSAPEWSEDEIFRLRGAMMEHALRMVRRKSTSNEHKNWANWIFSNDIEPFSFIVCCKELGYDYKIIRESLIEMNIVESVIQDHYCKVGRFFGRNLTGIVH